MSEPIWFVVEIGAGGAEVPGVYHDHLPDRLTRKGSVLLVYHMRIDRLPDPDHWLNMTMPQLYHCYKHAKATGKLVHNTADPPKAKAESGRLMGQYWEPKPLPYHRDPRVDGGSA